MLLSLVTWLGYVNPYLLYVFPVVIFITSGKRNRIGILLYSLISTYDMVTSLGMKLGLCLCNTGHFCTLGAVSEFINNRMHSMGGKPEGMLLRAPSSLLSSGWS